MIATKWSCPHCKAENVDYKKLTATPMCGSCQEDVSWWTIERARTEAKTAEVLGKLFSEEYEEKAVFKTYSDYFYVLIDTFNFLNDRLDYNEAADKAWNAFKARRRFKKRYSMESEYEIAKVWAEFLNGEIELNGTTRNHENSLTQDFETIEIVFDHPVYEEKFGTNVLTLIGCNDTYYVFESTESEYNPLYFTNEYTVFCNDCNNYWDFRGGYLEETESDYDFKDVKDFEDWCWDNDVYGVDSPEGLEAFFERRLLENKNVTKIADAQVPMFEGYKPKIVVSYPTSLEDDIQENLERPEGIVFINDDDVHCPQCWGKLGVEYHIY